MGSLHRRGLACGSLLVAASVVGSLGSLGALGLGCFGDDPKIVPAVSTDSDASTSADSGSTNEPGDDGGVACTGSQVRCGSACVDLTTSADNCGRCGRSCGLGSTCGSGRCAPISLATQLDNPTALVAGSSFLVMNVSGALARCGKDGCAQGASKLWTEAGWTMKVGTLSMDPDMTRASALATQPNGSNPTLVRGTIEGAASLQPFPITYAVTYELNAVEAIANDDKEYFFSTPYRTLRCFLNACASPVSAKDVETPTGVALSPTHYVWTMVNGTDSVQVCPRPAPGETTYAGSDCGEAVGLAPQPTDQGRAKNPVVFDKVVYWTEVPQSGTTSRVLSCPIAGCNRVPTVIASAEQLIGGLAVDATGAYWTNTTTGTIRACRDLAKGCDDKAETLATGATNPGPIAVDDAFVYYVANGSGAGTGALLKVAK